MPNIQLFDTKGNRKYLTPSERERFAEFAKQADGQTSTFCLMLLYTGCRISEALALKVRDIDYEAKAVTFMTLKQRQSGVFRQVPLPDQFLNTLNQVHDLRRRQDKPRAKDHYIWTTKRKSKVTPWTRKTGHSKIIQIMKVADLAGIHATPKGLRHAFAIACLDKGVPLNMVQKWMGHSSITTTAIYANATGEEERNIAARLWGGV